jgi:hypothetical protein
MFERLAQRRSQRIVFRQIKHQDCQTSMQAKRETRLYEEFIS